MTPNDTQATSTAQPKTHGDQLQTRTQDAQETQSAQARSRATASTRPKETQKLKLLYLTRMFFQETDEEHGVSMPQILAYLEERGITAERKAIYRDVEALRSFGLDIQTIPRRPVEYALFTRTFTAAELRLLVDAVQSSRFLTKTQAASLVRAVKTLASKHDARALSAQVHVEGRIKMQNASVFRNVDVIQEALRTRKKVAFHYFKYDINAHEQLQHGGDTYVETPLALVYSNDYYYLVVYNEKHDSIAHYRVDRMRSLLCLEEPAASSLKTRNFDIAEHMSCAFGMYSGEKRICTLLVREDAMSGMVDRFGKDLSPAPAEDIELEGRWARIRVSAMESPAFYSWLAQFGTRVRIEKPRAVAENYASYLTEIVRMYRPS